MKISDQIGNFEQREFPSFRNPTIDTLIWGRKRHHIPILLEIDVTEARIAIRDRSVQTGVRLSFTGWVFKCLAQALSEHKYIHEVRKGLSWGIPIGIHPLIVAVGAIKRPGIDSPKARLLLWR